MSPRLSGLFICDLLVGRRSVWREPGSEYRSAAKLSRKLPNRGKLAGMTKPRLAFGPFVLNRETGTLLRHGLPVPVWLPRHAAPGRASGATRGSADQGRPHRCRLAGHGRRGGQSLGSGRRAPQAARPLARAGESGSRRFPASATASRAPSRRGKARPVSAAKRRPRALDRRAALRQPERRSPSSSISPTGWPRTSSPASRACAGCSWRRATPPSPTAARRWT